MASVKITGDIIVSAISKKIKASWPKVTIYKKKVLQGMKTPCFFVYELNTARTPQMRDRARRGYLFLIRYHPLDGEGRDYAKLREIGNELMDALVEITLEDQFPLYCGESGFETTDGYLSFTVSYQVNTKRIIGATRMQGLGGTINLKEKHK